MTKYRLKTDVLWYEKGTTFWFDENHHFGKMLFIQRQNEKPTATLDALFNEIARYGGGEVMQSEEVGELAEYFEKLEGGV